MQKINHSSFRIKNLVKINGDACGTFNTTSQFKIKFQC